MLKHLSKRIFTLGILLWSGSAFAQLSIFDQTSPSLTQQLNQVLDTSDITGNPLRHWARFFINSPDGNWAINVMQVGEILSFGEAENATLQLIKTIINTLLWFVGLVVLVLLIYQGYRVVVAGADTERYKVALSKLKNYAIAISGIALSRFLVQFIFYVLGFITS